MISVDPAELTRQILAGFKPPPRLQLSQYADEFAVMTGNAAEKGRWNTLPYQREILDSFTNPAVETVAIMKSARVGWTKMLGVVVQYYSHQDPCPVMIVQPVKEDAEGYSKEEIKPLFEDTPVLRGLISESKSRGTASNTILLKQLGNGGLIDIVNAASGRSFRRKSARWCCSMRLMLTRSWMRATRSSWAATVLTTTGTAKLAWAARRSLWEARPRKPSCAVISGGSSCHARSAKPCRCCAGSRWSARARPPAATAARTAPS
jgi:hypothetical protein